MKHKLYNRLLSLALAVGLVIGMLPSAAAVDTVGDAGQPVLKVSADNGLEMQKTVEPVADTDDQFKITLEAWTTGEVTQGQPTPSDIVLVVDMSTSMESQFSDQYTPVYNVNQNSTYYVRENSRYKKVTWCSECKAWTDGCSWFLGHIGGNRYTPKTDANSGGVQFYTKPTRLEALQQAANAFISQVAEQSTDDKIAIVGFGQSAKYLTGGSAQNAFYDATTRKGELQGIISGISNDDLEGATEHGRGLANTVEIFKSNNNPNRNKIVVVITDGEPAPQSTNNWSSRVVKQAINNAYTLKNTYHAQIYSVSVMPGTNAANPTQPMDKYMSYISSNYPNAQYTGSDLDDKNTRGDSYYSSGGSTTGQNKILAQVTTGNKVQDGNYYLTASNIEELEEIFGDIGDQIETPKINLDETAVLQDEVTKYFVAPDSVSEVTIQTDNYNGTAFENNPTVFSGASVTFDGNKVKVSGFDYSGNFISDTKKLDGTYGKKLIVSFVVQAHPDFWGGNGVPTNVGETSGIYNGKSELVENFVQPDPVDVPLKEISLTSKNVNIYYGGNTPEAADLVKINPEFPNDWRTDYVKHVTYSTSDSVSNTQDGSYTVIATLSPLYEGTYKDSTTTAKATVNVFTPTITWQDSSNVYGTELTNEFLAGHNAKTEWKHGTTDSSTVTMFGNAPSLTYEFTDETGAALDTLKKETNVKVTSVKSNNVVVPNASFKWQAGAECSGCTNPNDEYQFRIHMATSHENEYPVRFYLEGITPGTAKDYPYSDAWAKLNSWLSGGFANVTTSQNPMTNFDSLEGEAGYDDSVSGGSVAGGIAGHTNVVTWLNKYHVAPAIDVNDISAVLTELVKMYPEIANAPVTSVGGKEYTVNEIINNPSDFQIVYTQVTKNHDQLLEYYKGNGSLQQGQDSYHVHLSIRKNPGNLTITKTFSGVESLPSNFAVKVTDSAGKLIDTLTLDDASFDGNIYTWTLENLNEDTYTVTETGTNVENMVLTATMKVTDKDAATPENVKDTTAKVKVADNETSIVAITNSYSAADGKLNINKVVTKFADDGKPVFDFKVQAADGSGAVYYFHVDMTGMDAGASKEVVKDFALPVGEYTIEELSNQNYKLSGVTGATNNNDGTYTVSVGSDGAATVTFTNVGENTNIPTDGGATENRVDKIEGGVIVWKKEVYGTDHPEPQPSPNPNDEE